MATTVDRKVHRFESCFFDDLPREILQIIYEFDSTWIEVFRTTVVGDLKSTTFDHFLILDRGFSVRNFQTGYGYRFYDRVLHQIRGKYRRGFWSSRSPL